MATPYKPPRILSRVVHPPCLKLLNPLTKHVIEFDHGFDRPILKGVQFLFVSVNASFAVQNNTAGLGVIKPFPA